MTAAAVHILWQCFWFVHTEKAPDLCGIQLGGLAHNSMSIYSIKTLAGHKARYMQPLLLYTANHVMLISFWEFDIERVCGLFLYSHVETESRKMMIQYCTILL